MLVICLPLQISENKGWGKKELRQQLELAKGEWQQVPVARASTGREAWEPFCWQDDRTEGKVSEHSWDSSFGVRAERLETECVGGMDLWVQWEEKTSLAGKALEAEQK